MADGLALALIVLGALLVTVGISGNYATPLALLGITLPGVETAGPDTTRQARGALAGSTGAQPAGWIPLPGG